MPSVVTDVFTVFVRVLLVCDSLHIKLYCCVGETAISIGAWLAVNTHLAALMWLMPVMWRLLVFNS
jgi:hypothetical protein